MDAEAMITRYVTTDELWAAQRRESFFAVSNPSFDPASNRLRGVDFVQERQYVLLVGEMDPDPLQALDEIAAALHIR